MKVYKTHHLTSFPSTNVLLVEIGANPAPRQRSIELHYETKQLTLTMPNACVANASLVPTSWRRCPIIPVTWVSPLGSAVVPPCGDGLIAMPV
jgi:hypothetical protein